MAIHSTPRSISVTYYTTPEYSQGQDSQGFSIRNQQDEYVFAKKILNSLGKSIVTDNVGYNFFIRIDGNKVFDPRKIFSIPEHKTSYIDRVCKGDDNWAKVPQAAFEKYLNFLKTENDQWLKETMRDSR